jgi:hypothetical protein
MPRNESGRRQTLGVRTEVARYRQSTLYIEAADDGRGSDPGGGELERIIENGLGVAVVVAVNCHA